MAAPTANMNAVRTGARMRLRVGELPRKLIRITQEARRYRRVLEEATITVHGEVSLTAAHHIDAATAAEIHGHVCKWILRQKLDELSATDIMACSREIPRAKQLRNAAVESLSLDRKPADPWDSAIQGHVVGPANGTTDAQEAAGGDVVAEADSDTTPAETALGDATGDDTHGGEHEHTGG